MKNDITKGILGGILGLGIGVFGFFLFWSGLISTLLQNDLTPTWSEEWYLILLAIVPSLIVGFKAFFLADFASDYFVSILKMLGSSVLANIATFFVAILVGLAMELGRGGPALIVMYALIVAPLMGGPIILIVRIFD